MKTKFDIFISYRREGGYDVAKHLNDLLTHDGYRVSFDIDNLRSGNFDAQLFERINQCKDFLLIVDRKAFDRTLDPAFPKENDWMRIELAYALSKGKNVVPIFLNGADCFPNNLPPDIIEVTKRNGPEYIRYYFDGFYKTLKRRFLKSKPVKAIKICCILSIALAAAILGIIGIKSTSEDIDQADIRWVLASFMDACIQNRGANCFWSVFSDNEMVIPKTLGIEDSDGDPLGNGYGNRLSYSGKLNYDGDAFSFDDKGDKDLCTITLYGPNAGPMLLEVKHENGNGEEMVEKARNAVEDLSFTLVAQDVTQMGEYYLYKCDNFMSLIVVSAGSGGIWATIYVYPVTETTLNP